MRLFSPGPFLLGLLCLWAGGGGISTWLVGKDVLHEWGESMGSDGGLVSTHWLATACLYSGLGLLFVGCSIGLFFRKRGVMWLWISSLSGSLIGCLILLIYPLPFGFQRIGYIETGFITVILISSWIILKPLTDLKKQNHES